MLAITLSDAVRALFLNPLSSEGLFGVQRAAADKWGPGQEGGGPCESVTTAKALSSPFSAK